MSESADHLLDELSKKLVDEVIPVAQGQVGNQHFDEPKSQKTPPSSLNDSYAEELLEAKLINTDESSVSPFLFYFTPTFPNGQFPGHPPFIFSPFLRFLLLLNSN